MVLLGKRVLEMLIVLSNLEPMLPESAEFENLGRGVSVSWQMKRMALGKGLFLKG